MVVNTIDKKSSNQDFLDFIVDQIHNVVVSTADSKGDPQAQICDFMFNRDGKLYIGTSKKNPFYQALMENNNKVVVSGYKGEDTMSSYGFSLKGTIADIGQKYQEEFFAKNPYLSQAFLNDLETEKKNMRCLEITPKSASFIDYRKQPIFLRHFSF